ncbi:MAG: endolytic transglycosylase MltG [Prevotella sp.]|nr:endolytic transglycosylase MltG [Prevotella sp.]
MQQDNSQTGLQKDNPQQTLQKDNPQQTLQKDNSQQALQKDNAPAKVPRDYKALGYKAAVVAAVVLILALVYATFFSALSRRDAEQLVYIDADDTADSVFAKVSVAADNKRIHGFQILARYGRYARNIHTGAYLLGPHTPTFAFFWNVRRGNQVPVKVVIPSVRTLDKFAAVVSNQLMTDSATIINLLKDSALCERFGCDTATISTIIIPNTYEMYWNISPDRLLDRLKSEADIFWNVARQRKAQDLRLSPAEVITLASIVSEETANDAEKPMIAGLYYNRLQSEMPLQADPTVKFATKNFAAKRIYAKDVAVDSPYNTYRNIGLPPGPISIPAAKDIDAVLDMQHHDYLYMCAKEDFSGSHNFAATYEEHRQNARRYAKALNERGIK